MVRPRKTVPDGRANNGGQRTGTPGTSYPNRSDMRGQPIATTKGQEYGKAGAQAAAQRAVPLAAAPALPAPAAAPAPAGRGFATPDDTPNLLDPTSRPDEPVTAGLPFGAGPGPEAMGGGIMGDVEVQLRALYAAHPTQELYELIRMQEML